MDMPRDTASTVTGADRLVAVRLAICGRVQGVGMRPAIARLAAQLNLAGHAHNSSAGVIVVLEGPDRAVESFVPMLRERLPPEAVIEAIHCHATAPVGCASFQLLTGSADGSVETPVPHDLVVCQQCLADTGNEQNRRYGYPFTSCADCGPRYSLLRALPFERADTAMDAFPLCEPCLAEYTTERDRRFHAQTIACPDCGPSCWLTGSDGTVQVEREVAISAAATALRSGQILAIKGLGGYQLLVDATNAATVSRLRERKGRPAKPLAVMVASLAAAESLAQLDGTARKVLTSSAGPIVIVPARRGPLAGEVHPGLDCVGLMLPTTPLHWLLAQQCPPLVATSGNCEGEPLVADEVEARERLTGIADCFLHHNREILRAIDDSVVRIMSGGAVTIRAARGMAPLTLNLPAAVVECDDAPQVLAVGGQQKGAIALFNGSQAVLGPHAGDLDEVCTRQRFEMHVTELCELYRTRPEWVVHDSHPDYFTSCWAAEQNVPTIAVQHHHAHVVSGMIEHGWLDREVLGVAWDGTGYGSDGTIWGGEFLRATVHHFQRVARLRPFLLLGNEAAIREPWRAAFAVLRDALGTAAAVTFLVERGFQRQKLEDLARIATATRYASLTSSAGRLFDAVASCLLPFDVASRAGAAYEGHWATLLEALCAGAGPREEIENHLPLRYRVPIVEADPGELDWRPLVASLVEDFACGLPPALIATRFHAALADAIVIVAASNPDLPVVLSGGVFQNRLLTEMVGRRLAARGQPWGVPGKIPPNDGGLAAGQLAVGLARIAANRRVK